MAFVVVLVVLLMSIPLFNVVVDPYWAFGIVEVEEFNAAKPQFTNELRLGKALAVCRIKPEAVILGSSRAELGLNPEHPGFARFVDRTYNNAMAGIGLHETLRTLQHAYFSSKGKLKLAILALDDLMFSANRESVVFGTEVIGYDEKRLVLTPEQSCLGTYLRESEQLLFLQGIKTSVHTLAHQDFQENYLPNGMRDPESNSLATGMPLVGHRTAFRNNEAYYLKRIWTAGPEQRYCLKAESYGSTMEKLRVLVRFARDHEIELRLFFSPVHARLLIAARESGLWTMIEDNKRAVVQVLAEDAARDLARKPFQLWDFHTFNSITNELVPPLDDIESKMKWYWEVSHYKSVTGDLVLDQVLEHQEPGRDVPDDFGILLTAKNIESELHKLLADSRTYDLQYPNDVEEIRKQAKEILEERSGVLCMPSYQAFQRGAVALNNGDREAAEKFFDHTLLLQIEERKEWDRRGLPYHEVSFAEAVRKALESGYVYQSLQNWEGYQERGNKRRTDGDMAGAVADYTEAIKRGPPNTALYFLRGTARSELKDYTGAVEDFEAGLKLEPSNATLKALLEKASIAKNLL